jgi:ketosteroid isomerase-like protein
MENVETHRATHDAFNRRAYDEAVRPMREDAIYTDHPRSLSIKGPLEFTDWMRGWTTALSDARVTDAHYIDGGEYSVCMFHGQGTNDGPMGQLPPTGRRMDLPFCEVLRYDNQGKIISGEMFYDAASMMVQLGHAEPMQMG